MQNTHRYKITTNIPYLWIKDFPWKKFSGHKYSRGRVVVYGGKKDLLGATILSSMAALSTGTGSVKNVWNRKAFKDDQKFLAEQEKIETAETQTNQ